MQIQITSSLPKYWYYGLEFETFEAELVEVPVLGHAHKIKVYEVQEGRHQGNFVLQGDCQVLANKCALKTPFPFDADLSSTCPSVTHC